MSTKEEIRNYIDNLKVRLNAEMPRISKEISVYEEKLANGKLTKNPNPGPQFNG